MKEELLLLLLLLLLQIPLLLLWVSLRGPGLVLLTEVVTVLGAKFSAILTCFVPLQLPATLLVMAFDLMMFSETSSQTVETVEDGTYGVDIDTDFFFVGTD